MKLSETAELCVQILCNSSLDHKLVSCHEKLTLISQKVDELLSVLVDETGGDILNFTEKRSLFDGRQVVDPEDGESYDAFYQWHNDTHEFAENLKKYIEFRRQSLAKHLKRRQ